MLLVVTVVVSDNNRVRIAARGGVQVAVKALSAHKHIWHVQRPSLLALAVLCLDQGLCFRQLSLYIAETSVVVQMRDH